MWYSIPPLPGRIATFPSLADPLFQQCYRYCETRENVVPCSGCQAQRTVIFRMIETWREVEQDACSSCSSHPPLESSNDSEIVTIGEEVVPGVPNKIERTFLMERLLESFRIATERLRLVQEDGGAPNSVPQDPQDTDTRATQVTQDTQDTQDTQ